MLRIITLVVAVTFLLCDPARSAVLFEDNFDSRPDWTIPQPASDELTCKQSEVACNSTIPTGYYDYRVVDPPYCGSTDGNHHTLNINGNYPRGGVGKSFQVWNEPCPTSSGSWGSDGLLGVHVGDQNELYVRYFIKFQHGFKWNGWDCPLVGPFGPMMKVLHMSHLDTAITNYWTFFSPVDNKPRFTPQLAKFGGGQDNVNANLPVSVLNGSSIDINAYFPNATADFAVKGAAPTPGAVGDGEWHIFQWHVKMNSPGLADGVMEMWYDGQNIYSRSNISWVSAADDPSLNRWNHLWLGGNVSNYFIPKAEQWYAVDDFVVSTTYIPDDYVIASTPSPAPTTTISPNPGNYTTSQSVTLTANEPATIYYTLDGSTPTTSSAVYSTPLTISANTTLKYFAKDTENNSENVKIAFFVFPPPDPPVTTVTPAGGTYLTPQTVRFSSNTQGASIYYKIDTTNTYKATADGSTPSSECVLYSDASPLTISKTTTVRYFSKASDPLNPEPESTVVYTVFPVTTIDPAPGPYTTAQTVTLTSSNPAATIYYTLDGSTPTASSAVYATPLLISATTTLKYFSSDATGSEAVQSSTYTIQAPVSEIIFEENFNQQADWQPRPPGISDDAVPIGGTAFYSTDSSNSTIPPKWTYFRSTGLWWGPTYEDTIRITNQADSNDDGKSLIIYNEANIGRSGDGWGADAILYKLFPADYNELYFRFKFKAQGGWKWATDDDMMIKIMRALHFDGTGDPFVFFSEGTSGPYWVWDFKHSNTYGVRYSQIAHPDPQADFSAVAAIPNDGTLTGGNYAIEPNTTGQLADGSWHTLDYHVKMNSNTGGTYNSDGVLEFSIDGVQKFSVTNARWKETTSPVDLGWNAFALGGNALNNYTNTWVDGHTYNVDDVMVTNGYNWKALQTHVAQNDSENEPGLVTSAYWQRLDMIAGQKEQWYAIDDVVVSTAPIPAGYQIIDGDDLTTPTTNISPAPGPYTTPQMVTLSTEPGATTYYTLDGSTPTTGSSVYSVPLVISATTTLKYFSRDAAGNNEAVQTAVYTITPGPAGVGAASASARLRATLR